MDRAAKKRNSMGSCNTTACNRKIWPYSPGNEPQYQALPALVVRLASVINCNTCHAGQIEYLSGLVKHGGWFPAAEK